MADVFTREFEATARRALSMWNRDPGSPSCGSFDRAHWGWKAKDFSDATLQYAVRLAVPYVAARPDRRVDLELLDDWLQGYVQFCMDIQHGDGSFDQCYPHERTPGVVYDMLSALLYVRDCGYLRARKAQADLDGVIGRAVKFALSQDERHGEIANHLGSYAFELLNYGRARGDAAAVARGRQYLERMLATFDRDEGWFLEYQGPDAGYQTRTLRYLTKCAELTGDPGLWDVAERSADFLQQVMMPDGSIHPMLGTRSTALMYPSGFMRLATRAPRFAPVAELVRSGWEQSRVPLPSALDFDNAIRLADDAREAAELGSAIAVPAPAALAPHVDLPRAGITVWRDAVQAVYVASRLGGVVVVYERAGTGSWRLRHEDSGYLAVSGDPANRVRWVTRFPGSGTLAASVSGQIAVRARFAKSLHDELTPFRMVVLRVLNMTFLRSQWIGDWFRRVVVRRLMDSAEWLGAEIEREVTIAPGRVTIRDRFVGPASAAGTQLFRCRRVTGTHMASARYFQDQEIDLTTAWQEPVPWPADGAVIETKVEASRDRVMTQ